jgi:hypothetical protein
MPVASYMDTEILCLMRLIGMCIPDKHIRRGSDDLEVLYQIFMSGFSCGISTLADQYTFSKR